jgi:hypothetical protein
MTTEGNFWANREAGAKRHTKKPKVLKKGKRVFIEGLVIYLKKIDTADCYTIFPRGNAEARILFRERRGLCQYRVKERFRSEAEKRTRRPW